MWEFARFAVGIVGWFALLPVELLHERKDRIWLARYESARIANAEGE